MQTKLRRLKQSDKLGIFCSSAPLSKERYTQAYNNTRHLGYEISAPLDPARDYGRYDHGFANGSVDERLASILDLANDDTVGALIASRGAYGCVELLPRIDFKQLGRSGKAVVGCSDVTAVLLQVAFRSQIPSIHGATFGSSFADYATDAAAKASVDSLLRMLSDPSYRFRLPGQRLRAGKGEGRIIAGNLSVLVSLLGTPWDVDYTGAVLVLEEVKEPPYKLHRMFLQLQQAGKLEKLAGLVLGRFYECSSKHGPTDEAVYQMLVSEMLVGTNYPVIKGLPVGHYGENLPLPIGCSAAVEDDSLVLLESPIA